MVTPDAELAYEALDQATAHPEHFDMTMWAYSGKGDPVGLDELTRPGCGATGCYAGWTAALLGYQVDGDGGVYRDGQPASRDIQSFAADLLGITEDDADYLFYVADEDLAGAVAKIFGPRPERAS